VAGGGSYLRHAVGPITAHSVRDVTALTVVYVSVCEVVCCLYVCVCSCAHDNSTATQRDTQVDLGRTTCRHVLRAERSKVKAAGSKCHNILIVMPKLLMIEFCLIISCLLSRLNCCSQFYDLHTRNNFLLTKLLVVECGHFMPARCVSRKYCGFYDKFRYSLFS